MRAKALFFAISLAAACSSSAHEGPDCREGKCDDPGSSAARECEELCGSDRMCFDACRDDKAAAHCEARRADATLSSQTAFTESAIRWAAADVEGVNTFHRDDRGQEYAEYYAVVQLPPAEPGGEIEPARDLGRPTGSSTTPLSIELSDEQIFSLEDEPDAVVGQCVFTSWHSDVRSPYPVCDGGSCPAMRISDDAALPSWMDSRELEGIDLSSRYAQMKISINSNFAAFDLVSKCLDEVDMGDEADENDPLHDNYYRGCWKTYQLFGTEWRRSDPTICAATMRLRECGCGIDTDSDGVADITELSELPRALVPSQPTSPDGEEAMTMRGFRLGTWSGASELPAGCRYAETGDSSQTLVQCDITASDVLTSASDVKNRCREKYGSNVVVHIPIPTEQVVCEPPEDGRYSESCGDLVPFAEPDQAGW